MDISPMSLQAVVPKSSEVTQLQHNMNQQAAVQQDFEAIRQKTDAALKQKQVRKREEMEDGKIKDDPDRQKKQGRQDARKGHGQAGTGEDEAEAVPSGEKMAVDTFRGHHIDIKL